MRWKPNTEKIIISMQLVIPKYNELISDKLNSNKAIADIQKLIKPIPIPWKIIDLSKQTKKFQF